MEQPGSRTDALVSFKNDVLQILKKRGFNWIRPRIFVDPTADEGYSQEGYCDLDHALQMSKRVKSASMSLLLDFHYSDNWADPGKQRKPAVWLNLHGAEFDIIGQSCHPKWHGTLEDLQSNLTDLVQRYEQSIVVVEYTGAKKREIHDIAHGLPGGKGLGAFVGSPTKKKCGSVVRQVRQDAASHQDPQQNCRRLRDVGKATAKSLNF